MFVVVDFEGSTCFISVPNAVNYESVCLIKSQPHCSTSPDPENHNIMATSPCYVVGDFVTLSQLKGRSDGLIGVSGCEAPCYVKLDVRKNTLAIRVLDAELMPVTCTKTTIVLHFK